MKISGGLALIGAVVAEFVAGSGTSTGLAWRIIEAEQPAPGREDVCRPCAAVGDGNRDLWAPRARSNGCFCSTGTRGLGPMIERLKYYYTICLCIIYILRL